MNLTQQAREFVTKRWADFRAFSPGQKAVTLVAVLALAVGGYLLATWKTEPTYAPLYSNLAASDASSIVSKLDEKGIPYKLTAGGAGITVPTTRVDEARLAVSAAGLPNSGQTGYALLDKEGVTTSQFKQQVDYQRAVEGELAKTIHAIDGVQAASVHLAIPKDNVFNDNSSMPTAAVMLTVAPGTTLNGSQVQSVVYLVSSSVQGMKPGSVTVTDSSGNVLSSPDGGLSGSVNSATQAKSVLDYNTRMAASIQAAIDATLGAGHARVVVNASLNFDQSTTKSDRYVYDPKTPPVSVATTKETYTGTGTPRANGTLGTVNTSGAAGSGNGNYSNTGQTVNNALGRVTETTQTAPGGVKKLAIAVLLDQNAKHLDPTRIESMVKSGTGYDQTRGDTLSVEAMPFDTSVQDGATKAAKAAASAAAADKSRAELTSMIKQGVFVALVLALVIGTWLASRRRRRAGGSGSPRPLEPVDDGPDPLDELPPEPEPVAPPVRSAADSADDRLADRRRSLVIAADNRPAEVAHLLSGWLTTKEADR